MEFETGIVWDGGTDTGSSRSSPCAAEWKLEQSFHSPEGRHLMAPSTGGSCKGNRDMQQLHPKNTWCQSILVEELLFCFVLFCFEFLRQIFTSRSLGFHCPTGGQSENRCGTAGCDGGKKISRWFKSNSGGKLRWGTGRAASLHIMGWSQMGFLFRQMERGKCVNFTSHAERPWGPQKLNNFS